MKFRPLLYIFVILIRTSTALSLKTKRVNYAVKQRSHIRNGERFDLDLSLSNLISDRSNGTKTITHLKSKEQFIQECPLGFFGKHCNKRCPKNCHKYCNRHGVCLRCSTPGVRLPTCRDTCEMGSFGYNCQEPCFNHCLDSMCDPKTGYCLSCKNPGVSLPSCDKQCKQFTYGFNCKQTCHSCSMGCDAVTGQCLGWQRKIPPNHDTSNTNSNSSSVVKNKRSAMMNDSVVCSPFCLGECDKKTGQCSSCIPGYRPPLCTEVCPLGFYGPGCRLRCSIFCHSDCNSGTGRCHECITGHRGYFCQEHCQKGSYGNNCSMLCPETCLDHMCDHKNGECMACEAGYVGKTCEEFCPSGSFGHNCSFKCSPQCRDAQCDPVTGSCVFCLMGYTGDFCNESCPEGTFGVYCSQPCPDSCQDLKCRNVDGKCLECPAGFTGEYCTDNSTLLVVVNERRKSSMIVLMAFGIMAAVVTCIINIYCFGNMGNKNGDTTTDTQVQMPSSVLSDNSSDIYHTPHMTRYEIHETGDGHHNCLGLESENDAQTLTNQLAAIQALPAKKETPNFLKKFQNVTLCLDLRMLPKHFVTKEDSNVQCKVKPIVRSLSESTIHDFSSTSMSYLSESLSVLSEVGKSVSENQARILSNDIHTRRQRHKRGEFQDSEMVAGLPCRPHGIPKVKLNTYIHRTDKSSHKQGGFRNDAAPQLLCDYRNSLAPRQNENRIYMKFLDSTDMQSERVEKGGTVKRVSVSESDTSSYQNASTLGSLSSGSLDEIPNVSEATSTCLFSRLNKRNKDPGVISEYLKDNTFALTTDEQKDITKMQDASEKINHGSNICLGHKIFGTVKREHHCKLILSDMPHLTKNSLSSASSPAIQQATKSEQPTACDPYKIEQSFNFKPTIDAWTKVNKSVDDLSRCEIWPPPTTEKIDLEFTPKTSDEFFTSLPECSEPESGNTIKNKPNFFAFNSSGLASCSLNQASVSSPFIDLLQHSFLPTPNPMSMSHHILSETQAPRHLEGLSPIVSPRKTKSTPPCTHFCSSKSTQEMQDTEKIPQSKISRLGLSDNEFLERHNSKLYHNSIHASVDMVSVTDENNPSTISIPVLNCTYPMKTDSNIIHTRVSTASPSPSCCSDNRRLVRCQTTRLVSPCRKHSKTSTTTKES